MEIFVWLPEYGLIMDGHVHLGSSEGQTAYKGRLSGVVYGVQCSEDKACKEQCQYIGETSQYLQSRMSQHRKATSSGNDSAV